MLAFYCYYVHSHLSHPGTTITTTTTTSTHTHTHTHTHTSSSYSSPHLPPPKSFSRRALTLSAPLLASLPAVTSPNSSNNWTWAVPVGAPAPQPQDPTSDTDTLSNIPETLSGECKSPNDCKKPRIQRPKSRKAESCTVKCVNTCIRGGDGAPGEGPLNIIRPLVVFKQGFRSRRYCLVECSDICNLIRDDDDYGP